MDIIHDVTKWAVHLWSKRITDSVNASVKPTLCHWPKASEKFLYTAFYSKIPPYMLFFIKTIENARINKICKLLGDFLWKKLVSDFLLIKIF